MVVIELNNQDIEKKYDSYELKMKFLSFLKQELNDDSLDLYEVSILPEKIEETYNNFENINFIKR